MSYLSTINETYTNGYATEMLNLFSLFAITSGVLVIIDKNPVKSILFLILLFLNISMYLITLGLNFIGLSYLIIYIGAVSILFLFILMLINIRTSELQNNNVNSLSLAIIITIIFSYIFNIINENKYLVFNNLFSVTSNMWDGNLIENNHITSIGNIMYTSYSLWLIIASLILLLAMIGAIVITIKTDKK